jgi:hypothetical protein
VSNFLLAVGGGLVGTFFGYLLRGREFRRDQRVKVYGEFIRDFIVIIHGGAELQSYSFQFGAYREVKDPKIREVYSGLFERHAKNRAEFEGSHARLRMMASAPVQQEAEKIERWIGRNIDGVPPFSTEFHDQAEQGKQGPRLVDANVQPLALAFADVASQDVNSWLSRAVHKVTAARSPKGRQLTDQ